MNDGSSIAFLNYLESVRLQYEVLVILGKKSDYSYRLDDLGIKYKIVPYRFSNYRTLNNKLATILYAIIVIVLSSILNVIAIARCYLLCRKYNPDLIHTNVGPLRIGFYVSKLLGVKHIWHLREYQGIQNTTMPFPSLRLYKRLLNHSYTISISHCIADFFEKTTKNSVIYDGVFDKRIEYLEAPYSNRSNTILFVGRVERSKGVEDLIDAFSKSDQNFVKSYKIKLVGQCENQYKAYLKKKIEDLGLSAQFVFLGVRNDVYDLMRSSKAVVVSSLIEGFGFVTAEAMYNETLVIGYDSSGTKEQFDNCNRLTRSELGFRYKTQEELISCINRVFRISENEYIKRGRLSHDAVISLYCKEINSKEIIKYYKSIL